MDSSATNYKITWFRKEDKAGTLDLSPQFQRRPVWSDEQAAFLVDTILSGLPIPEIYIRSSSSPTGDTRYEVVDGQQRIRSILSFASNDLELTGEEVNAKWFGKSFDDLNESEKTAFWDYKIVVRDVSGATDLEIRDLFKRLNIHSVVLNDQELRHAKYSGKFIKVMEELAEDEWWLDSRIVNVRQIRRMEDVEYISELFVGMIAGPQDKKKTLDDYYDSFEQGMPKEHEWVRRFRSTRELIELVFSPEELRYWSGKSDFYTLFQAFAPLTEKKLGPKQRSSLSVDLMKFRRKVDQAKKKDNTKQFGEEVHNYADAVSRAATDIGRRATRLEILEKVINGALSKRA
jgi:hypothetical protein